MEREAVVSGAIRGIGYDAERKTLEIEFRTGRVYQYEGVPAETHAWLLRIENKGGFLNRMVIDRFPTHEVTPTPAATPALGLEAALRASLEPNSARTEPEGPEKSDGR